MLKEELKKQELRIRKEAQDQAQKDKGRIKSQFDELHDLELKEWNKSIKTKDNQIESQINTNKELIK